MKSGNLTSWNPLGHSRPVTGLLYIYLYSTNLQKYIPTTPWSRTNLATVRVVQLVEKLTAFVEPEGYSLFTTLN